MPLKTTWSHLLHMDISGRHLINITTTFSTFFNFILTIHKVVWYSPFSWCVSLQPQLWSSRSILVKWPWQSGALEVAASSSYFNLLAPCVPYYHVWNQVIWKGKFHLLSTIKVAELNLCCKILSVQSNPYNIMCSIIWITLNT